VRYASTFGITVKVVEGKHIWVCHLAPFPLALLTEQIFVEPPRVLSPAPLLINCSLIFDLLEVNPVKLTLTRLTYPCVLVKLVLLFLSFTA
jgi:hypothetical protein